MIDGLQLSPTAVWVSMCVRLVRIETTEQTTEYRIIEAPPLSTTYNRADDNQHWFAGFLQSSFGVVVSSHSYILSSLAFIFTLFSWLSEYGL